jgi:hypothetical protein
VSAAGADAMTQTVLGLIEFLPRRMLLLTLSCESKAGEKFLPSVKLLVFAEDVTVALYTQQRGRQY